MIDRDAIAAPGTAERALLDRIRGETLPHHVAIIMDGNGRWARARGLPRIEGHRAGIRAVRTTVETAARLAIPVVTLYAFSTENWKRPAVEIKSLWGLLKTFVDNELDTLKKNNIRLRTLGDLERLEPPVRRRIDRAKAELEGCTGPLVQIALNYSGRQELVGLVRNAVADASRGTLEPGQVDEQWVADHLETAGTPDPDLLIRTSGEQRISNFLLWQIAYSEIYFSPALWPDFGVAEFLQAILAFQGRERRFGGLTPGSDAPTSASGDDPVRA
jgi:undecaprenyl diphosphate synthase